MNESIISSQLFEGRHIGPNMVETLQMLKAVGAESLEALLQETIPSDIRLSTFPKLPKAATEQMLLSELQSISEENKVFRNYMGQGYHGCLTPSVILRKVFQNPSWYTQYTPYQAEISQGRLESLLNFQTMVADLTCLPLANASLLDEATAAAEAMNMFFHVANPDLETKNKFFVEKGVFPQTLDVLVTRANGLGIEIVTNEASSFQNDDAFFGALLQYPDKEGHIVDYAQLIKGIHDSGGFVAVASDLLALTVLEGPGSFGADAVLGNSQRFGVPLGYGGPHAAFFAVKDVFKRSLPGRLIGVSIDAQGSPALRMAMQTREQHIKREKATSNICTAQALLANMAALFAVYHGPEGLKAIAARVNLLTEALADSLEGLGYVVCHKAYFDTIKVEAPAYAIREMAEKSGINLWYPNDATVIVSLDETTNVSDIIDIAYAFAEAIGLAHAGLSLDRESPLASIPEFAVRKSSYLTHPVFNSHHSETKMMRYIQSLENKDLSLTTSMIPLGSCTMKLNAASELIPVGFPGFANIHPFAPASQTKGYSKIVQQLESYLCAITGFDACSLQPNSGAQGEYAGLLAIKGYHNANGGEHRDVMLIPISAHGTNPASAVMAGLKVVVVKSTADGSIDVADLEEKATLHAEKLAGLMVTYPSTHGVFEGTIKSICGIVHSHGGLVYMDGANMNAQTGLVSPKSIGADVCHLNLHKTFAIPHGGGGPGVGPICVTEDLAPFLPGHLAFGANGKRSGAVSAAPFGSASILLISYAYIRMLGAEGLKKATEIAILNANYMMHRLEKAFKILYKGENGRCAHEFILDLRPLKTLTGIEAEDVAKRLMDFGFHAPTVSFPVAGTMMIEPTESEGKNEMDRFCDAMLTIHREIMDIAEGKSDKTDNPLKNAPHTQAIVCADVWTHNYGRQQAAFPLPFVAKNKFWPSVARVNNTHGDRNLVCTCPPMEAYTS